MAALGTLAVVLAGLGAPPCHAISSRVLFTPTGTLEDQLGATVASAGDFNADGHDDVMAGAVKLSGPDPGRVFLYLGGPGADATPDFTFTGEADGDNFSIAMAPAGDVNGDGFDDLIIGAPWNDTGATRVGRAYVYFGGPSADTVADLIFTGEATFDEFGTAVGTAGDINADGFDDLIVGAPYNDAGGSNAGRVYIFFGGPSADSVPDIVLTGQAGDNFGVVLSPAGDVNDDGYDDFIVGAPFSDAGGSNAGQAYVYFGGPAFDTIADITFTGEAVDDFCGYAVAGAGDVNGDGSDDLLVGAPFNDAAGSQSGRAYLYLGGRSPDSVADLTFTGAAPGDFFGQEVAPAGDVNGDGFDDFVVGAYFNDAGGTDAGAAYLYFGGSSLDATPDLTLTGAAAGEGYGSALAAAGDIDGDGYGDIVIGAWKNDAGGSESGRAYIIAIYPYRVLSPNGGEQWVAGRPVTVSWLGHDRADLAFSFDGGASWTLRAAGVGGREENRYTFTAPGSATSLAKVRLSYSGQTASRATSDECDGVFRIVLPSVPPAGAHRLQLTPTGAAAEDAFGVSVASAGDMNGDGFDDVIVGAYSNDAGGADAGRAHVYHGGPAADAVPDLTLTGAAAGDFFGVSVASAGDVNGDGFDDVIVGAFLSDAGGGNSGAAYVYYGGPADSTSDLSLIGEAAGDLLGASVASAGDIDGDGYADLIVGAPGNDAGGNSAGRAYVYRGGPGADALPDLTLTGEAAGDFFGISVASAGDVNGDGFDDVIAGAYFNDAGGADAGRAYVYYGGPGGDAVPDLVLTGEAAGDFFGVSVASAGDVNGDGFGDVIVGAYLSDAGGVDAGRAYVYYGGPVPDAVPDLTFTGAAADDNFGVSVASAGDMNGDGRGDLMVGAAQNDAGGTDAGRAYLYFGGRADGAVPDLTFTGAAADDNFGVSVASAGDVNGDGFADLVVGAPGNDEAGGGAGRAYLYDCNRYFVLSPNDDEVWNVGAAQSVSWLGAERADVWLSVNAGRTYDLLRHDVGGDPLNSLALLVPQAPTRFARIKVTPVDPAVRGLDESDSTFTIQGSVALLNLAATLGADGATISWNTEPGVGPDGLAGYRLYRVPAGESAGGTPVGPGLIRESSYTDPGGAPGQSYRLTAVNGLQEELELGRVAIAPTVPLAAWPLPYRGGSLHVSFGVTGLFASGAGEVVVELFDVGGRRVKTLARGPSGAGYHTVTWDGRDDSGIPLPDGVYFLRAVSAGVTHRLKVVVLQERR